MISSLASKWQGLEICQLFYEIKLKTFLFKILVFEDREDIMTKFKSQALHVKKKSNIENLREDVNEINTIHKNKKIILKRKYKPFRKLFQQKYKERFQCILLPFNALLKVVNIVT